MYTQDTSVCKNGTSIKNLSGKSRFFHKTGGGSKYRACKLFVCSSLKSEESEMTSLSVGTETLRETLPVFVSV